MSESKRERERKVGGKNVCMCICGERNAKGRERKSVKKKRAKERENEKIKERIRERKRESIVVHGDTHIYNHTRAKHMEMHTDTYTRHI